ncbi:hypothetical protein SAMN04488573_10364 [Bacillus sp. 5mfcol3.1]|nr:hypothetical protein IE9_02787 [Bacillus cereus BAG4X12-1]EOP84266.1 hypothetical protein IEG_01768 [Bacillus cereus BAG5X12-1]SFL55117.1 hypothetical protein SAMN04488573_10364 [Bacillus sp. 5mfcol3.1]
MNKDMQKNIIIFLKRRLFLYGIKTVRVFHDTL